MDQISHHIMDLAENSTAAGAGLVEIRIVEDLPADRLTVEIADDGRSAARPQPARGNDAFQTDQESGLGLTLFARACEESAGRVEIEGAAEQGSRLRGWMQYSHPNRKPLGDLGETLITLLMGSPGVSWVLCHEKIRSDGRRDELRLDTRAIQAEVGNMPLAHPEVIRRIRVCLRQQQTKLKD
ncbi:MAG: hypothetical protein GX444_15695 [Myxococcales bacterium]|nr:hypothetical protein [Myxococcales bacterium]